MPKVSKLCASNVSSLFFASLLEVFDKQLIIESQNNSKVIEYLLQRHTFRKYFPQPFYQIQISEYVGRYTMCISYFLEAAGN